jgi:hypothetical protein
MSAFFGRRAALTIQRKGTPLPAQPQPGDVTGAASVLAADGGTKTVIPSGGLRIQFKIEKNPQSPPNTADISVTNLAPQTRRQLQEFGAEVELRAGYLDNEPHLPLLFRGQARTIDHLRKGADWVTRIQCGDGEIPFRFASVNASFRPGTPTEKVARTMALALQDAGVDVGALLAQLDAHRLAFVLPQFVFGYASQGNALQELSKILGSSGYLVSIQNGELRVIPSSGTSAKDAILLSPSSGLKGSPEHGTPDRNGLPTVLKVKAVLLPHLEPGDAFVLAGVAAAGKYRADKLTHAGDTHAEDDWTTEAEARVL